MGSRPAAEGRAVLFVHHAGKGGPQRGTSRKEDVLDSVIALRRPEDYKASEGARFEVHFEKTRGFTGPDAEPFEATLIEGGWATREPRRRARRAGLGTPPAGHKAARHRSGGG